MSYPSGPPGNSGYQSGPQAPQYGSSSPQYGAPQEAAPAGPSKLPVYLAAAVTALGIAVYLASFGPVFTISTPNIPGFGPAGGDVSATPIGITLATAVAVVAGLLAGVTLLPKQGKFHAWVAILSVLALLIVLTQIVGVPEPVSFGWALYLIIVFSVLQALVAVAALLLESDVISAPAPRPKQYDQQPYGGQYGAPGGYYGGPQGGGGPQDYGQPQHGGAPQQRPSYTQSAQYGGYAGAPTTGGFPSQGHLPTVSHNAGQSHAGQSHLGQNQNDAQNGPPTPPTGFPAFGQPQQTGSAHAQSSESGASTNSFDAQPSQQQAAPPSAPPPS